MTGARDVVYHAYSRALRHRLADERTPAHVGVILDGNRRWASLRRSSSEEGHRAGAAKIAEFLGWCEDAGVEVVTLWLLSTDNLERDPQEVDALLQIIGDTVWELTNTGRWRIHPMGALDLLPDAYREQFKQADERTASVSGMTVNVAVGYGGRREVVDAVRSLLMENHAEDMSAEEIAQLVSIEGIGEHLYTKGQPDPDLVIRTSGEQRLSGFLLWQSAHSEFYFCEAFWPDFREVDFLRALRSYAQRERRFGT
ncbi:MAG: isoprenyl transferase [Actinobacteria bacterium]|nr:isoprenyl transferase [Actinomycetota bacterium]